jgi:hypothetical protein
MKTGACVCVFQRTIGYGASKGVTHPTLEFSGEPRRDGTFQKKIPFERGRGNVPEFCNKHSPGLDGLNGEFSGETL